MKFFNEKYLHYILMLFGISICILIIIFYILAVLEKVPNLKQDISNSPPPNFILKKILISDKFIGKQQTKSDRYHLLGTDSSGWDILYQIIMGTRSYFLPGLVTVLITLLGGILMGSFCGYYENFITNIFDNILALLSGAPKYIVFLIAIIMYASPNIYVVMILLGFLSIPKLAILIRSKVWTLKNEGFIEAGIDMGFSAPYLLFKHIIFHHCLILIITSIFYVFAEVILVETTLNYLGILDTKIYLSNFLMPVKSWGALVRDNVGTAMQGYYWQLFFPSAAIIFSITGLIFLADSVQFIFKKNVKSN